MPIYHLHYPGSSITWEDFVLLKSPHGLSFGHSLSVAEFMFLTLVSDVGLGISLSGDDGVLVMHGALISSLTASSTSWAFWEEAACFVACVVRKRDAED